ncbi:cytidylate kinase family protein [Candidatus Woesearchaeota archaeon]|nr:cytidylate kinase family protein [Candidatus Woesearchaeota archaeon]
MIITISGHAGSGKSTVANLLAEKLGYKRYSVGDLRREMAQKRGLTLEAYNKLGEKDRKTDTEADAWAKRLGETQDDFIIDGRVAWHFIPHSFKIFLDVQPKVAAERAFKDHLAGKRTSERAVLSLKDVLQGQQERQASDVKRYRKYYGITYDDKKHFDFYYDTSKSTPAKAVQEILKAIRKTR